MLRMQLGQIGIWQSRNKGEPAVIVQAVEELGYGALWLGGSPSVEQARVYVEAGTTLPVITGILNVWQHDPADVARDHAKLTGDHPDRFLLGIGIGHPEATSDYTRPLKTMRDFFDGLDAAETPVPKDERLAAALGPKMLDLSKERSLGTHPYFIDVQHTRFARERLGPDALVAPEVAVVVEADPETARKLAREYAKLYLGLTNYTSNLLKFGYTERDIADGGSDRLIDAVIPHGSRRADRGSDPRPPRGGRGPRLPPAARPWDRAAGGLRASGEGAALADPQPAERLLDQLRPVGGRRDLLEAEAQQQRVVGRRAGEELRPLSADLEVAAVRRAARGRAGRRSRRSSRPRSRPRTRGAVDDDPRVVDEGADAAAARIGDVARSTISTCLPA